MPRKDVQKAVADLVRQYIHDRRAAGEKWEDIGSRFGKTHAWAASIIKRREQILDADTERRAAQVLTGGSVDRLHEVALAGGLVAARRYELERTEAVQLLVQEGMSPDTARRGVEGAIAFKGKARADELARLARSLIAAERGKQVGVQPVEDDG